MVLNLAIKGQKIAATNNNLHFAYPPRAKQSSILHRGKLGVRRADGPYTYGGAR